MKGPVANKEYVNKYLQIYETKAQKKFGQNFLIDDDLASSIIENITNNNEHDLLEIGPGLGALTYHLLNKIGHKYLVEIDDLMVEHLNNQIQDENVTIIDKDILKLDLNRFKKPLVVVGNLPYYITTEIIEKLLKSDNVKEITLMVQKEAYYRIISPLNTKEYSPLSIFIEYWGGATLIKKVSRHSYLPEPHVDSVVFQVKNIKEKRLENEKEFFKITNAMFLMRRKTILNNLTSYLKDKEKALQVLDKLNCPATKRPEQLNLDFYLNLTKELSW